ncbi:hypothetical protein ACFV9C_33925 [Kribbella sp. NPDC059898]|uniref:hypothetical protein n=1 Tax=Kribbella sp. NPDC059898 TaxID=3346995 RepID=UPI003646F47C
MTTDWLQLDDNPFQGAWPALWIRAVDGNAGPGSAGPEVVGFRLRVEWAEAAEGVVQVSADERYELWVDGEVVGRGPSRGEVDHWSFESYHLRLPAGEHWLAARVWSLGDDAPLAQQSLGDGPTFLLASSDLDVNTGTADWHATTLPGHALRPQGDGYGCGARHTTDGRT